VCPRRGDARGQGYDPGRASGSELGLGLAEELQRLAPFGRGNPAVSLLVADATFTDARPMGEGKHVRFNVESGGARARAVAFGTGGRLPVGEGEPAEATFTLEVNEWRGVTEPRLVLRHARPARSPLEELDVVGVTVAVEPHSETSEEELVLFAL
jgi:single-stranded-DNA-specific exonuclease